ncbi:non-ribosomal peptide synthetase [Vibrio pectenicida]|uniref:non-ribosomal peptide synthetase n=1 Tax=Vibrio pectenicida TaxID=62763 RepID=UPI003B99F493
MPIIRTQKSSSHWKEIDSWGGVNDLSVMLSSPINLNEIKKVENKLTQHLEIKGEEYQHLKDSCQSLGVTVNTVLQFAWHKLINIYTGDERTIVGTTASGTDILMPDSELSASPFVNTLPLFIDWSSTASVVDMVQLIQAQINLFDSYSEVPVFGLDSNEEKLFHSLIIFQDHAMLDVDTSKEKDNFAKWLSLRKITGKLDVPLVIVANENGYRLTIEFDYDVDWLSKKDSKRLIKQLHKLLLAVYVSPYELHSQLLVLDEAECVTVLKTFNDTKTTYPHEKMIYEVFEAQVLKTPNKIALSMDGEALTYDELNQRANQIARRIEALHQTIYGVIPVDKFVALFFDRSIEMIVSILAVLKAGAAYVPISPDFPSERVDFIIQDTQAPLILTHRPKLLQIRGIIKHHNLSTNVLCSDDMAKNKGYSGNNRSLNRCSTDLAYVIYTSGTTGKPKGVLIEHHSVVNLIQGLMQTYPVNDLDVTLMVPNYIFDASVEELFVTLFSGAKLVLPKKEDILSPSRLQVLIDENQVTRFEATPTWLGSMVNLINWPKMVVIAGGEALPKGLIHPNWRLINTYGPTEATVTSHYFVSDDETVSDIIPIGKALHNYQSFVLNNAQQLLPIGAVGELYIGGVGIGRGYLNRPQLTQERFIKNPFANPADKAEGFDRLYKTGDLVRWLPDGNIEYLGREDKQVKIRGYRIELGEITSVLNTLACVQQSAVIDVHDAVGQALVGYVVPKNEKCNTELLHTELSKLLPGYMVPSTFVILERIPFTLSGKLDQRALPKPEREKRVDIVLPENKHELQLAEIWQNLLGMSEVGVTDNFFQLGGNSILSVRLMAEILNKMYQDIELKSFLLAPTIRDLAKHIENNKVIENQEAKYFLEENTVVN